VIPSHISPEVRVRIEQTRIRHGKSDGQSWTRPEPQPHIPTPLEDWDEEFKRQTGKIPTSKYPPTKPSAPNNHATY
jgi:hypothetical protein